MANRFQVRGINDDKSFCECCGKSGLARVVWIEDMDTGEIKHFGTSCAAKPAKGFDCATEIKSATREFDATQKSIFVSAGHLYRKVYNGARVSGVDEKGPFTKYTDEALWTRCIHEAKMQRVAA